MNDVSASSETGPLPVYRGRLAPSPTGYLHLGHARTFWVAQARARERGGGLVLRNDDLDRDRCRPEFVAAMFEDLRWFGFEWQEGSDVGGAFGPYDQSRRLDRYRDAFRQLQTAGCIYPCRCSRKDIRAALSAPHAADEEPPYPGTCRPERIAASAAAGALQAPGGKGERPASWRFRVPDSASVEFVDARLGLQSFEAGRDFGDFVVWRHDDLPSYQLACVVDDAAMRITEVVRGEDLLVSTARQLLLYAALELPAPAFCHCELLKDERGVRLAKRSDALSLRALRAQGARPQVLRAAWWDSA